MGKSEDQNYAAQHEDDAERAAEMQFNVIDQDYGGNIEAYMAGKPPDNSIKEVQDVTDDTTSDYF